MQKPRFGLHLPKSQGNLSRKSIFDDDDGDGNDIAKPAKPAKQVRSKISKTDQRYIEDALKQDPSIFAYDEVYDSLKECKKTDSSHSVAPKKTSRYITGLLKAAEEREIEHERRFERKLQKEREDEGDAYADKESFITNSYREKLEKYEEMDKKRVEEEQIEAILDVKKQGNLNSFYKFMLKNKSGELKIFEEGEKLSDNTKQIKTKCSESELLANAKSVLDSVRKRQYRRRQSSSSGESSEEEETVERSEGCKDDENKVENVTNEENIESNGAANEKDAREIDAVSDSAPVTKSTSKTVAEIQAKIASKRAEMQEFVKKKTIGQVYVDAQKRYFARAKLREQNKDYIEKID